MGDALSGWWGQRDSNPYARSAEDPKSSVSAVSQCPHMAGDAGLEPACPGVKVPCLNQFGESPLSLSGGIRTHDPMLPKHVRCQTALHSDE